ncbi:putative ABC transporter permease [Spirochaeta dissipatitropha]
MVLFGDETSLLLQLWAVFTAGSVLGWLLELGYRSGKARRLVNPGLLHGPLVPLYGFGLLLVLGGYELTDEYGFLGTALLLSLAATLMEYVTGALLESLLGVRLWDYRDRPLNLQGRVCFQFSLYWFVLVGLVLIGLDALAMFAGEWRLELSGPGWRTAAVLSSGYIMVDVLLSWVSLSRLRTALRELRVRVAQEQAELRRLPQLVQHQLQRRLRHLLFWSRRFPALGQELLRTLPHPGRPGIYRLVPEEFRLSRRLQQRHKRLLDWANAEAAARERELSERQQRLMDHLAAASVVSPVRGRRVILAVLDPDDPVHGVNNLRVSERLLVNLIKSRESSPA